MIRDQLDKIEKRLNESSTVKTEEKAELMKLVTDLRSEIADLSVTHREHAESITGFAELSSREAMRSERNPALVGLSIEGLAESVRGFEVSHPRLVAVVNNLCTMLANLGI